MKQSSLAENDNEEVEIKKMVAAAEVMVMVAETASLAEVENEETEIMVMVVDVTDFVYGVILFKNEEHEIRKEIELSLCSKEKKKIENTKGKVGDRGRTHFSLCSFWAIRFILINGCS